MIKDLTDLKVCKEKPGYLIASGQAWPKCFFEVEMYLTGLKPLLEEYANEDLKAEPVNATIQNAPKQIDEVAMAYLNHCEMEWRKAYEAACKLYKLCQQYNVPGRDEIIEMDIINNQLWVK